MNGTHQIRKWDEIYKKDIGKKKHFKESQKAGLKSKARNRTLLVGLVLFLYYKLDISHGLCYTFAKVTSAKHKYT